MKKFILYPLIFSIIFFSSCSKAKKEQISSETALNRLLQGNERFVQEKPLHPNQNADRRKSISSKQTPFAVIVGCSDSRTAPEIIFDTGLGDLFVVRVAGNVIGSLEMESIDYAVHHLHASLILILAHENCGAINATLKNQTSEIPEIAKLIQPAVQTALDENSTDALTTAIKLNALNMKQFLENSDLKKLIKNEKVQIKAAYYNFDTGSVQIIQ